MEGNCSGSGSRKGVKRVFGVMGVAGRKRQRLSVAGAGK